MSASSNTAIQFNFKMGNGDLINLYADSVTEAHELLEAFSGDLVQTYHNVASVLHAAHTVAVTPNPRPAAAPTPSLPGASAPAPAATGGPMCDHGQPAKLIPAGINRKTNRPYSAFYACAQPRELQCGFTKSADAA